MATENKLPGIRKEIYKSPVMVVFIFIITIFLIELGLMNLFELLPPMTSLTKDFIDAALLVILLAPEFYFFIFRPFNLYFKERQQVEDNLRKSESLNRTLLNAIPDIIFRVSPDGTFLDYKVNQEDQLYVNPELITGKKIADLLPPLVSEQCMTAIARSSDSGTQSFEYQLPINSSIRNFEARVVANPEDDEVVFIIRDITEQKQTEEMLDYEQYLFSTLMDNVPDHIYFKDEKSRFIKMSKAQWQRFGFSDPSQVIGKTDFDIFKNEHARQAYEDEQEIIRTGKSIVNYEEKETWLDGSVTWVSTTKIPLRNNKGQIIGTFGVSRDITDGMRAKEDLLNAKEFSESLIRTANVIVIGMNNAGEVNIFNEEAETITGYTFGELKGKNWFETLVPKEKYPDVHEVFIRSTLAREIPKTFTNPILTKSGEERYISWQNGMLYEAKEIAGTISFGIDITESKHIEEALAHLSQQNQLILNSVVEGILGLDTEGNHTFINLAASGMLGFTPDELVGRNFHNLWHHTKPDGTPYNPEECPIYDTLKNGKAHHVSSEIFWRKDGTCFPVTYSSTPIYKNSQIVGAVVTFSDITKIKRAELEREVQSEIADSLATATDLSELLKMIHISLCKVIYAKNCFFALYDKNSGLFSFPYYIDQYDTTPEPEAMPKSCTAYVYRSGKSLLLTPEIFQQLKTRNEVELVGLAASSWIGIPLKSSSGTIGVLVLQHYEKENVYSEDNINFINAIASQVANVIERKRTEKEILKFKLGIEHSTDAIFITDPQGVITYANASFEKVYGYTIDEVIGHTPRILKSGLLSLEDYESFWSTLLDKKNITGEILNKTKDGRIITIAISNNPILDNNGNIIGFLAVHRDVTERNLVQEALKENEVRLRELNATKDKFFSIIAHDLKNPFNAIIGFSNILADQISKKDYEGIGLYAGVIQNSSQRAMDLLMNLMEWSRSQTGRIKFNPQTIDIVALIREVTELSNDAARQKSISIDFELPVKTDAFADTSMISTVLRNLISNAIKFTNPGGRIIISAEQKKEELIISIQDNGVGISKEAIEKLFRIDESYSTIGTQKEMGTGLGLLLCKEFVLKHGGKIRVESQPGKGSTFYFTIPGKRPS